MTPTTTYTGIREEDYYGQHPPFPIANPPPLPPLKPIVAKVTMDTNAHLPSTWRQGFGKLLTNKRIIELQREGHYGSGLKLPPLNTSKPCCECGKKENTRFCSYEYLPKPGVYCKQHIAVHRAERDKQVELRKKEKELFLETYV
jgi:hypothetical protein